MNTTTIYKLTSLPTIIISLIFFDSFFVYFGRVLTGNILAVNFIIPILLLVVLFTKGSKYFLPPEKYLVSLTLCSLGFLMGAAIIDQYGFHRVLETGSAASAFLAGYIYTRWNENKKLTMMILIIVGLAYSILCTIALFKVSPHYFPVIIKLWAFKGSLIERPEITTDQNFQIFYLLPVVITVVMCSRTIEYLSWAIGTALSLYVISELQTRSGLLVLFGAALLSVISPLFIKGTSKKKIIGLISIISACTILAIPIIIKFAHNIIIRFTETDYSTGIGRLESFTYLFDKVYNPLWWLPRGNSEFIQLTGNIPHSNLTAIFMDGGILSLGSWIVMSIIPLYNLGILFLKKKLDQHEAMIFIGALSMFIIQLSLNVPLMDSIWLWSGLALGTYLHHQYRSHEVTYDEIAEDTPKINTEKYSGVKLK